MMRHVQRLLAMAVMVAAGGSAFGQVRQVIQGNGMDANPQVGSGGSNQPVPGYVPVNGNDIITGNVSGLKYFHGNVPYSSNYEVRGGLGNGTLNNFIRQSSGAPLGQPNLGVTQPFYLPSRQTSAAQGAYGPSPYGSGVENRYAPGTAISALSPNAQPISAISQPVPINATVRLRRYDDLSVNPMELTPLTPTGLFGFRQALGTVPLDRPIDALEKDRKAREEEAARVDLGKTERIGPATQAVASVSGRVDSRLGRPRGAGGEPEEADRQSEVYDQLQRDLRLGERGSTTAPGGGGPSTTLPGSRGASSLLGGGGSTPNRGPTTGPGGIEFQSTDPSKPFYLPPGMQRTLEQEPIEKLQSGRDVKPIETFRGKGVSLFDQYMASAEKQLSEGHYIDAASTYQGALEFAGDNPLPLIGRAHAQLGAGMYLAAAEDLRLLFEKKPELIAVRYDLTKFMPEKRLDYLIKDASKLARSGKPNPTANFALAYMDYQLGRSDDLKLTLQLWHNDSPKDPWPRILARAWVEGEKKK